MTVNIGAALMKGIISDYKILLIFFGGIIFLTFISVWWQKLENKIFKRQSLDKNHETYKPVPSSSKKIREDKIILSKPLRDLDPYEFERLMYLYFCDHGYEVEENGGTGDGGVDLILTDKQGFRTAVQIKHWNINLGPSIVRETYAARLNTSPSCHMSMVITSGHMTNQAKTEAEARHMEYWPGTLVEDKLKRWPKYTGFKKSRKR